MCCFQNELYCLRCHDKMGIPICGACRRPIEERVVTALGKHWHVEVSFMIIGSYLDTCTAVYFYAICIISFHIYKVGFRVFGLVLYDRL